jgi:tetratricopeptide (TPR) repeat protein
VCSLEISPDLVMKSRREVLLEFLASDPNDSFSRYALALELEKEGRQLEAVSQLQELVTRDPGYVGAYYQLGRLLAREGRTEEAREVYQRGLSVAAEAGDQRTRKELQEAIDLL